MKPEDTEKAKKRFKADKNGKGMERKTGTFNELKAKSTEKDGSINTLRMESQEGRYGSNGGRGCDTGIGGGACSCGAWH